MRKMVQVRHQIIFLYANKVKKGVVIYAIILIYNMQA